MQTAEDFIQQAIRLALNNAAAGQLPFGAVVVRDGQILATGVNTALRDSDPTAHAEVAAIRTACANLGVLDLTGSVVYASCEPCVICQSVAATANVDRIVYAAPADSVPDLKYPAPADHGQLLAQMQTQFAAADPTRLEYLPVAGSTEPFARYLA